MNHKIFALIALLATAITATSCFGDDDEEKVTTYSDTSVTSFSLGTFLQKRDTIGKDGADSTYYKKVQGDAYNFYINQVEGQIFNTDSLPSGTKTSRILAQISTKNSGFVMLKSLNDNTFTYYSSADSIDFSSPRVIRVYANDAQSYKEYTIKVNVHKQEGNRFSWKALADNAAFGSFSDAKALTLGNRVLVFGTNGSQTKGYSANISDGNTWTTLTKTFSNDAYKSFVANSSKIYTLDNGSVLSTNDATNWALLSPNMPLIQLLYATDDKLYALSAAGNLVASTDEGATWNNENISSGSNNTLLPATNISTILLPTGVSSSTNRLLLSGVSSTGSSAISWTKLVSQTSSYAWTAINSTSTAYALPAYKHLTTLNYGGKAVALGLDSSNKPAQILVSEDGGITWKPNKTYTLPSATATANSFAATIDKEHFLWIIYGSKVWKGILTKLSWASNS